MEPITVILTSCNRWDLLAQTLESFHKLNTYPIHKFIIHNDATINHPAIIPLVEKYRDITWMFSSERQGLAKSLDILYSHVKTEYVFTCEDDFLFSGNKNFMGQSLSLLNSDKHINQVWIRDEKDHQHPLTSTLSVTGIPIKEVTKNYQGKWGGFSFNPGLRRLSDYRMFFPNGFSEFGDEAECSKHVESIGYKAVSLANSACKHIGFGRHTEGFKV